MFYDAEPDQAVSNFMFLFLIYTKHSNVYYQGEFLDIISFNKYEGWYIYPGQLDVIENLIIKRAEAWRKKYNKPVLMTEYGADTTEGLHLVRNKKKSTISK